MKLYYVDCIVLILINLISCLSADDRFATSHRLSWKEFAQRTPLKHCEQLEDAWLKRYQDKDYVQENTVATFQKDLHLCQNNLDEGYKVTSNLAGWPLDKKILYKYCTTDHRGRWYVKKGETRTRLTCAPFGHGIYTKPYYRTPLIVAYKDGHTDWTQIEFPKRMRVSGIREVHWRWTRPYGRMFHSHITVQWRLYEHDPLMSFIEDGKEKIFKVPMFEGEVNDGFGVLRFDHDIVAKYIYISTVHFRSAEKKWISPLILQPLGCQDDIGVQNFQYYDSSRFAGGTLSTDRWLHKVDPEYEAGCPIFDFEDGELANWTMTGNAFTGQPTHGDNKYYREKYRVTGFLGDWWVSTLDHHPNPMAVRSVTHRRRTGTAESPKFFINSTKISFLMGGGGLDGKIGVELLVFNEVVAKHYLVKESRKVTRYEFDVSKHMNEPATIKLVDQSTISYLMFDDLRTVEQCDYECGKPLGMESGAIPDESITSSVGTDPGFSAANVRISSNNDPKKYFRVKFVPITDKLFGYATFLPWLEINLPHESTVSGWMTQSVLNMKGKCGLYSYHVMYLEKQYDWRYLSTRNHKDNSDRKIHYIHGEKSAVTRVYLSPRISAKKLRFVLDGGNAGKTIDFCFRIEIFGCSLFRINDDNKQALVWNRLTTKQRMLHKTKEYSLKVLNIPDNVARTGYNLTCLSQQNILNEVAHKFTWNEIIFKSYIELESIKSYVWIKLEESFFKRNFQCQVRTVDGRVIFTQEFALLETTKTAVVPIVTSDIGVDYRGGHRVLGNPAVFPTEGSNLFFYSINLANLIIPYLICAPQRKTCPNSLQYHAPYHGYRKYGKPNRVEDPFECFDEAIQNGERAMTILDFTCYAGPMIPTWYSPKPEVGWKHENSRCFELFDEKEYLYPCKHTCGKLPNMYRNYPKLDHKKYAHLYKLHYTSVYEKVTITITNDIRFKIFSQTFDIAQVPFPEFVGKKYISRLFPRARFYTENSNDLWDERDKFETFYDNCKNKKDSSTYGHGRCGTFFSHYNSDPWGASSLVSFIYMQRDQVHFRWKNIKVEITTTRRDNKKEDTVTQYIDMRYNDVIKIELDSEIGLCYKQHKIIEPKIHVHDRFNIWNRFRYQWFSVTPETQAQDEVATEIPLVMTNDDKIYRKDEKLIFFESLPKHSGNYQFILTPPMKGDIVAKTRIKVYKDFPRITWLTRSPYRVVPGTSDILEIRTNTDELIKDIFWYHEKTEIRSSNHYRFIDGDLPHQRKRLLLKNIIDNRLAGTYHVELIGLYCSFKRMIIVSINIPPLISITPSTGYKNYLEKKEGEKVVMTAKIVGGLPAVDSRGMYWKKNGNRLRNVPGSRLSITKVRFSETKWSSVLTITELGLHDEATYSFVATAGKAQSSATKILYVNTRVREKPAEPIEVQNGKEVIMNTIFVQSSHAARCVGDNKALAFVVLLATSIKNR